MTLRHVVMWKMAAEDAGQRVAHATEAAALLRALEGVVPSIRAISAGPNMLYPDANWDLVLLADFDDVAGLDAYQVHPAHLDMVAFVKSVVASRAAVDVELRSATGS